MLKLYLQRVSIFDVHLTRCCSRRRRGNRCSDRCTEYWMCNTLAVNNAVCRRDKRTCYARGYLYRRFLNML